MQEISFGEILKHYRKTNNLTQEELASGICSRKYVSKLEQDQQIPTLDIVNKLGNKLGINLYDTYALVLRHHNIETHEKIERLNSLFTKEGIYKLKDLIDEYSQLDDFQYGEPKKVLAYAKCLYLGNVEKDFSLAVNTAYSVLIMDYPRLKDPSFLPRTLTNCELSLILSIAVNYCRTNSTDETCYYYEFLLRYLKNTLRKSHYVLNKNYHYEIDLYGLVIFNLIITYKEHALRYEDELNYILEILKSTKNCFHLPELLYCKA